MQVEHFWSLIDESRQGFNQRQGFMEYQLGSLKALLAKLPPEELLSFRDHFSACMAEAYRWDVWGAAFLLAEGCSDDGFLDFRAWLISRGRQVFEQALENADSLAEAAFAPGVEDVFFEALRHLPNDVYTGLTRRTLPPSPLAVPEAPAGTRWSAQGEDLKRRFPQLWAKTHPDPLPLR